MEFIDVNSFIGKSLKVNTFFDDAPGLCAEMKRLGMAKAYVFHSVAQWSDLAQGNTFLLEQTKGYDQLVPVMVASPLIDQEHGGRQGLINYLKENRIGAVRLAAGTMVHSLAAWNMKKLFEVLSELRFPCTIDGLDMGPNGYNQLFDLCHTFPDVPVILVNPGYRSTRMQYSIWEQCDNFHVDTSLFIANHEIEDVVKYFGAEKILYGSRMPYLEPGTFMGRVMYASISDEDKAKIAAGNIKAMAANIRL